jgi:TetR/AcrR family transcriptional regulator
MDDPGGRRGRTHDAEGTRQAILDAAEEVFSEHGFDGARVDAIAKTAGYNKSLIFQYFGDKLGLYAAVIRRADEQTRTWQNEALDSLVQSETKLDSGQIRKLLATYVGWYFDYLVEHPHVMRIYLWEMAEGWQTFSRILTQNDFDDINDFSPVLTRLQQAGMLRSDLNPIIQVSHALFTCALYLALPPLYKALMSNVDFSSPKEIAHAREFVISFVVNGLLIAPS